MTILRNILNKLSIVRTFVADIYTEANSQRNTLNNV